MQLKILLGFLVCTVIVVDCAKILAIFHFPSKSHHILGSTLLKALAAKGHQVTMLSPFPLETPLKNYEDIELTGMLKFKEDEKMVKQVLETQNSNFLERLGQMTKHLKRVNELFLNHVAVKNLLASNRKFDLVIQCSAWNEVYLGLAHHFEASSIIFSTVGSSIMTNGIVQNPTPYSYVPNAFLGLPSEMTFLQRLKNALSYVLFDLFKYVYLMPMQESFRRQYFPNGPTVEQLLANVSLVFLNSHYSIESARPHVPNMIQIGGFHVEEPRQLTGEIKKFMDSATEGVLFFSLGSNVKSSDLPDYKLEAIIKSFAKLPLKVLWKFEKDDVSNLPPNVKIGKWLPQRDILAHPNLKVFVTHGGLLSTTEAVYHGVPMVGIPFFGDQDANVEEGVNGGYIVKVPFVDLTESSLTAAIKEILNNSRYRDNIQERSIVLKDQPLKPIDNAIFWVEYVLRHSGAHHLKTSALKLEWYQYYLLDVITFLVGIVLITLAGCYCSIRKLVKLLKRLIFENVKKEKHTKNISRKKRKFKMV